MLKGASGTKKLVYFAEATWTCDDTTANEGEHGIYFASVHPSQDTRLSPGFHAGYRECFGDVPMLYIVASGDGRMLVDGGRVQRPMVSFPPEFAKSQDPKAKYGRLRSVPLTAFEGLLASTLKEQDRPWISASAVGVGPMLSWELDVAFDRRARLVVHGPSGCVESRFDVPPRQTRLLDRVIRDLPCATLPLEIGRRGQSGIERGWTLHPDRSTTILDLDGSIGKAPDEADPLRCALTMWKSLRGLIDDPTLIDGRSDDEVFLTWNR